MLSLDDCFHQIVGPVCLFEIEKKISPVSNDCVTITLPNNVNKFYQ